MLKICIIILANSLSVLDKYKEAVAEIPAAKKQRRDLGAMMVNGAKKSDIYAVVYCREEDLEAVKQLYKDLDKVSQEKFYEDITFKTLDVQDEKPVEEWDAADFENLKKGELEDLCKDREDLFGEIKYSTKNKAELVELMASAVSNQE